MRVHPHQTPQQWPVRAVLFDLDDTLFDHQYSSRVGLAAVQQRYGCFQQRSLDELAQSHARLIEVLHAQVLQGMLSLEEARVERFRQLFAQNEEDVPITTVEAAAAYYRGAYQAARRPVPGVIPMLRRLRTGVKIAVVTNNVAAEQRDKLQACGLESLIDALVVSEEIGVVKPHPSIFEAALDRVQCTPAEAVMVGDSWQTDIIGAYQVGIRPIWFNRSNLPCPDPALATELKAFEPLDTVVELLLKQRTH